MTKYWAQTEEIEVIGPTWICFGGDEATAEKKGRYPFGDNKFH